MTTNHLPLIERGLDARVPLLLLPVNLETRFIGDELWLRVYPDQIAINSHEPELTAQEIADGTAYWDALWQAGNPPASLEDAKAPWRGLAQRYGAQRAAWIALTMTPTNAAAQPAAATPAGTAPVPPPVYPSPATRDDSWQKPAVASALPEAWTVVLFSGNETTSHRGGPITAELAVGLTPGAAFPPGSPVPASMQWLTDFDTAVAAGMALKIPLTVQQRAVGFERILVYGLRSGDGAAELAALFDAHHYTDGFSFVPQGAPSNNTSDASAGYARKDDDFESSFAVERKEPLNQPASADGNCFAAAIGIDPKHVTHVAYAGGADQRNGTDMLTALWAATLGYFLTEMMADVFTPEQIDDARQYVEANAIPRGPVPAFRVGKVPYGVLPVTSLRRYALDQRQADGSIEPNLVDFVKRLWPAWLQSSSGAPHMQRTGDPDKELVGVLGMDASSMSFRGRQIFGDQFLWNYGAFCELDAGIFSQWWVDHALPARQLLDHFGYTAWNPRLLQLGLAETSFPVNFPTVQVGPLSETEPLKADANLGGGNHGNYIQWLRGAAIDDIRSENYPGPKPTSLLYKILRESLLLDYVRPVISAEIAANRLVASQVREAELVGIPQQVAAQSAPVSVWEVFARPAEPNPTLTWAEYLLSFDPPPESPFARLAELRASLDRLALLPTAELDRLLTETLDACSHRLDVWATAIANALLKRARAEKVPGVHLGGFGWVEDVRPSAARASVQAAELERVRAVDKIRAQRVDRAAAWPIPVQPLADNGGYIYAPSLGQAATAAVLRSGYMTHVGTPDEGLLAVDLSSDRVRRALYLLHGVQQGQSLSALLGFLFEAQLHDLHLDQFVQPFRDRFPVTANKLTPSSEPSEALAASNVVDGVALRAAFDGGAFPAHGNWGAGLPAPGADQTAVLGVIRQIDEYADALADLSMAEAVFQIIRGNFGRAGGLMDAISRGERPADPAVIDTPRGGLDLTHRVALLFAGAPLQSAAWSSVTPHPRGAAEPWLEAWLSYVFPDPAGVVCQVVYRDAGADHVVAIRLLDLDCGVLDCLALADAAEVPQESELEARILLAAAIPASAEPATINYDAALGTISFSDFFFLVKSVRLAIGAARALAPQDLTVPEKKAEDLGGTVDLVELRKRATDALASLTTDTTALQTAAAGLPSSPGPVRAALIACSFYGIPGSLPRANDDALAAQATAVFAQLDARKTKASSVPLNAATLSDLLSLFAAIFGDGFAILPRFTPPDRASLQAAFGESAGLIASDPVAPARWFTQLTHVRPAISRLDASLSLAQMLGAPAVAPLLAQLPFSAGDRWLALPFDPKTPPEKGRVALACFTEGDPVSQTSYAGLLIDEWPERIPSRQEQAAVAFHFEEPKARAPQALLLAVCPDDRAFWDDDLLSATLEETLELTKIRTVDLDSVQQVGQLLPALYFALNLKGATISANFARETQLAVQIVR